MRWQGRRQSTNVEDRRSFGGGGAGMRLSVPMLILVLVVSLIFGGPRAALRAFGLITGGGPLVQEQYVETEHDKQLAEFVKVVFADTEDVWKQIFSEMGETYQEPTLVIYRGYVQSGCGGASSQVGPFYCPADRKVYIDLSFYDEMQNKLGARGDFAFAYVVAHEVGHHVQTLLGVMNQVQDLRQSLSQKEYNRYNVALELQADYCAGVWASRVKDKGYLEQGDLEEAIKATEAVGDDTLQRKQTGTVMPDTFTHGTAEQRSHWFELGYKTGDLSNWNTFQYVDQFNK